MSAPRFKKWWLVPDKRWRHTVRVARAQLRLHQRRLADAVQEIQKLTFPVWLQNAFLCIHRFEGAWTSNTGNGYYGGMQMDRRFMSTYGPEFVSQWGTADNWPVWAQLEASKRAYPTRGFTPWPNTARACGLL
ncbi:transglycosylase family protein [Candidatus Saccharibacteria bacterium]|nr:transglycosylase family protein [Candidatus Saccharibacteria bacterium]